MLHDSTPSTAAPVWFPLWRCLVCHGERVDLDFSAHAEGEEGSEEDGEEDPEWDGDEEGEEEEGEEVSRVCTTLVCTAAHAHLLSSASSTHATYPHSSLMNPQMTVPLKLDQSQAAAVLLGNH